MRRSTDTGLVSCPPDSLGNPRPPVMTTPGETWVISGMKEKGYRGVTTRDFLGADLRHYIRALKQKGLKIRDEWETDTFGRHKRWFLEPGHEIEVIPKKAKPATADGGSLNPKSHGSAGGSDRET